MRNLVSRSVALALAALAGTVGVASARTPTVRFTATPKLILSNGSVVTRGDDVLEVNETSRTSVVIDQTSGAREALPSMHDCLPDALGPANVIYGCPENTTEPDEIFDLATKRTIAIAQSGTPIQVGLRWAEFTQQGPTEHSATTASFVNLANGTIRTGAAAAGGRSYDDLNRRDLLAPLCAPLRVPSFTDPTTQSSAAATVQFVGRTALFGLLGGGVTLKVQKCGSRHVARYDVGGTFTTTPTAVIWPTSTRSVAGVAIKSGRMFDLKLPGLTSNPVIDGMTATTLYIQQQINNVDAVALPGGLVRLLRGA